LAPLNTANNNPRPPPLSPGELERRGSAIGEELFSPRGRSPVVPLRALMSPRSTIPTQQSEEDEGNQFSRLHQNEKMAMRVMQALILVICYAVARFVGSDKSWDLENFDDYHSIPAHWCIILCIIFVLTLQQLVPELVVEYNVMMR
jgi:hypothetical protein